MARASYSPPREPLDEEITRGQVLRNGTAATNAIALGRRRGVKSGAQPVVLASGIEAG
jgi:hypothetical protein